ncbi:MAG: hypothetical protein ACKV19_00960 [Verrucomicrobiales bacterium]
MKRQLLHSRVRALSLAAFTALALATTPTSARATAPDLDGDGIPNVVDPDIDNDGIPNALDKNIDGGVATTGPHAGRYIGDRLDNDNPAERDIDDDGLPDDSLGERDVDGDGKIDDNLLETDIDGDRRDDDASTEMDIDGDGRDDDADSEDDIDGDSLDDDDHGEADIDGDDRSDDEDEDIDGDHRDNSDGSEDDTDGDGRGDADADEDNDDGDSAGDRDDSDDDNDGTTDEDDADHRQEDDEREIEVSLTAQPAAPARSRSRVKIQRMATGKVEFEIDARDLPEGDYEVVVNGVVLGALKLEADDDETEGEQEFETNPNDDEELPLPFDPSGLPVELRRGGVVYFAGTVPTPPPPGDLSGVTGDGGLALTRTEAAPAGSRATAVIEFENSAAHELEIELHGLPVGSYELIVGDTVRGTLAIPAAGDSNRLQFKTDADDEDEFPLDFPVAGAPVAVTAGGVTYFFGTLPANPNGGLDPEDDDNGGGDPVVAALTRGAGLSAEAEAEAEVQFGIAGPVGLEIEAEEIPAGSYEVVVGGEVRGLLIVAEDDGDLRGKLRFESVPSDPDELLLDFAAAGQPVIIRQGDRVFFTGTTPTAP